MLAARSCATSSSPIAADGASSKHAPARSSPFGAAAAAGRTVAPVPMSI